MSVIGPSGNPAIDGILWGVKWDGNLTYGFPTTLNDYGGYVFIEEFQAFNAAQRSAVSAIMGELNAITGLNVTLSSNPATANLRFAEAEYVDYDGFGTPGIVGTAYGTPPDDFWYPAHAQGDMFYNRTDFNQPVKGAYDYTTLIHELGHAIGLKHGHTAQESPNGSFIFPKLPANRDSMEYSVMTYRSAIGGSFEGAFTNEEFGFAQSWMMNDIAALQYLYGADFTANAGNTAYSWSPTTGEMFINGVGQGAPGANRVFLTIWDGNGIDTYDMSNYTKPVRIDLSPGSFSITSQQQRAVLDVVQNIKAIGNVFNALLHNGDTGSLIENAAGGSGKDRIIGNEGTNTLTGNAGADTLNGLDGNDSLFGNNGADKLKGGNGDDILAGSASRDRMTGGNGNDAFVYTSTRHGGDTILDFSSNAPGNDDRFEFSRSAFGGLAAGPLDPDLFQSSEASTAADADVRFFFETDTGILRFDADGSGTASVAVVIATIQAGGTIAAGDILIV